MASITGKITAIENGNSGKIVKNIVTIENENETAYVEFRGVLKLVSEKFKINERVKVTYLLKGSTTKRGFRFNNLAALKIKRL